MRTLALALALTLSCQGGGSGPGVQRDPAETAGASGAAGQPGGSPSPGSPGAPTGPAPTGPALTGSSSAPPATSTPDVAATTPGPGNTATAGSGGAPATGGNGAAGEATSGRGGVSADAGSSGSGGERPLAGAGGTDAVGGMGFGGDAGSGEVDPGEAYFGDWPPGAAPEEVAERLVALFAGRPSDGSKHYKEACAWYGALQVAGLPEIGAQAQLDALVTRYQPYFGTHAELVAGVGHVDENVWGIVPLELFTQTGDERYLEEGLTYADHQQANIDAQIRYAIDDMFMITGLQIQAYRATRDGRYLDLAAATMVSYLERLQQPDGTFFHHEDVLIKWGRGNGWVASGLTELLRELPEAHPDYPRVRDGYESMMEGLLGYQLTTGDGAGLWKQVLDYDGQSNWPETSGSAMFAFALITGVKLGILEPSTYGPAARQAWLGLVARLETDGRLRDVSDWMWDGTVDDYIARQRVTGDDHGQAPMLWSAAALLR